MSPRQPMPGPRRGDERGQTAVLVLGFAVIVLMTIVVVVDASAAYLRRQALDTLADGAALAAADGIEGDQVYTGGLGDRASIDPERAGAPVQGYLDTVDAGARYPGLRHTVTVRDDRVVVRVASPLDLPFGLPGVRVSTQVSATAAAVVAVAR